MASRDYVVDSIRKSLIRSQKKNEKSGIESEMNRLDVLEELHVKLILGKMVVKEN